MAGKDKEDDITVNVDDPDTVTVDVNDDPQLAEPKTPKQEVETAKVAKDPKQPRTRTRVSPEPVVDGPSPEEALAQAQAYAKTQEEARRAAEATAANERAQREQAQREASQAQQTAEQLRERADNSELAVIENGIEAAKREIEAQETEYTRAAEAGEFAKMAKIQTKLSSASAKLDRLEDKKASFESGQRTPTTEGRVEAPAAQTPAVEQYLAQFSPVAQSWLRQHPECMDPRVGGNATKNSMMMAGHYAAIAKNVVQGTPEYFKIIEDHIDPQTTQQTQATDPKITSKAADIQQAGDTTTKTTKHVQPSAPVTRDAPNSGQPRTVREVRLSKEQQEMAKVSFPHLPEAQAYGQYARNLIELEAEGKIGRTSH